MAKPATSLKQSLKQVIISIAFLASLVILSVFSQTAIAEPSYYPSTSSSVTLDPTESDRDVTTKPAGSPASPSVSHKSPWHSRQFGDTIN